MSYLDAIILGIVQGLTEFLPVSSSGHLVLAQELLGVNQPGIAFELILHLGTLVAVIIYFRKAIWRLVRAAFGKGSADDRKMILWLVIGTIPAGVLGIALKDFFEQAFASPVSTSWELIITGAILLSTRFARHGERRISFWPALIMGCGQAIAIMPGISRSGTTIAAGLFSGVKPAQVAEFSLPQSIPAVAGAILLDAGEIVNVSRGLAAPYLIGALVAMALGILSVYVVLATVKRGKFDYFAYYCFAAGVFGLYLFS